MTSQLSSSVLYQKLGQRAKQAGLYRSPLGGAILWSSLVIVSFSCSYLVLLSQPSLLLRLLALIFITLSSIQSALWTHDAVHGALIKNKTIARVFTNLQMGVITGYSVGYWTYRHTTHHVNTNTKGKDIDLESPLFVFYPEGKAPSGRVSNWIARYQHLCVPILGKLHAFKMRKDSISFIAKDFRKYFYESFALIGHYLIWIFIPLFVIGWQDTLINFFTLNILIGYYLNILFFTNHQGRDVVEKESITNDFLHQIYTSRNIKDPARWFELLTGGLVHQATHHVLQSVPSWRLRRATQIVREFCLEHQIPYEEETYSEALRAVENNLRDIAKSLREKHEDNLKAQPSPVGVKV